MKLHYAPRTRSSRPRWVLEEAGALHEIHRVDLAAGENKTPAYKSDIHPHGSLPSFTFTEDGVTIVESAAICLAIADRFPEKHLAPKLGSVSRARYYQWVVYVPATIDPVMTEIAKAARLPEDQRAHAAVDAKARWKEIAAFIDKSLGDADYLIDDAFTVADVLVGGVLIWASSLGQLAGYPTLQAYVDRLKARPAYQRAIKD